MNLNRRPPLYWEFHEGRFAHALRMRDWKGVRLNPGEAIELYDIKTDPGERDNIASRHPDVFTKIGSTMASNRIDSHEFPVKTR